MHQFSDVIAASPHPGKPLMRDRPQLDRAIREPSVDGRILFRASRETEDFGPADQSAKVQRDATRSI